MKDQCMDQVSLTSPKFDKFGKCDDVMMKIIFQVGTINTVAALGKLVVQSSEKIAFLWSLTFTFIPKLVIESRIHFYGH